MKKVKSMTLGLVLVGITLTQTGCFGTFSLTNKIWEFNKGFDSKYAQEGMFLLFCIIPVYPVCAIVDAIVLNSIEFWTGSNPIAMKAGEVQTQTMAIKGEVYKVTAVQNKFIIEKKKDNKFEPVGKLEYKNKAWFSNTGSEEHKLVGYNDKGQVEVYAVGNKVYTMDRQMASAEYLKKLMNETSIAKR